MSSAAYTTPMKNLTIPDAGRDHLQGPSDAPIALLEYGDYECPFCGEAHRVIREVQDQMGRRLCFAHRNFPLVGKHPHAAHAAETAEAAAAQERFWDMHDLLYENQDELADEDLARYATMLGLDGTRLISEVLENVYVPRLREDVEGGIRAGVDGTPTLFINGQRYTGRTDVESLLVAMTQPRQ